LREGEPSAKLPEDKRQRIIDAAIREFAEKGYEQASTNAITAAAGISKGLLFHYFGTKKQLYLHLVEYALDYYGDWFRRRVKELHPDIMERMLQIGRQRVEMARENPVLSSFYADAFFNMAEEVKPELTEIYRRLHAENTRLFADGVDMTRFREDVDPRKAVTLVMACLEGLRQLYKDRAAKGLDEAEGILADTRELLEMLKFGIYRREPKREPG
jgi:AcrR family transcriptional regulator